MTRRQLVRLVQGAVIALALPTLAFGATGSSSDTPAKRQGHAEDRRGKG